MSVPIVSSVETNKELKYEIHAFNLRYRKQGGRDPRRNLMNLKKLKELEKSFLKKHPGGFDNPFFVEIAKKHKMRQMVELTRSSFGKASFKNPAEVVENYSKIVTRSSMVSLFEKPRFRDYSRALSPADKKTLATGLEKMLHGAQKQGFEMMLEILEKGKLAKWSLITIVPAYYKPDREVFVKPTTAKGIIDILSLENLEYKPRPSWTFYQEYRKQIDAMKTKVNKNLSPSNAAFSGFLMMCMNKK